MHEWTISMVSIKLAAIIAVISLLLGGALALKLMPPKEVTKIEVQEKEVIKNDVTTVKKEIKKPDGTIEDDTIITDHSTTTDDKKSSETIIVKQLQPQWLVTGGAYLNDSTRYYNLLVQKRLLGPVFAGINITTNKDLGLVVSVEF